MLVRFRSRPLQSASRGLHARAVCWFVVVIVNVLKTSRLSSAMSDMHRETYLEVLESTIDLADDGLGLFVKEVECQALVGFEAVDGYLQLAEEGDHHLSIIIDELAVATCP